MRIVQILPTLSYGDAIGNDVFALGQVLREMGFEQEIYAEKIGKGIPRGSAKYIGDMSPLSEKDIVIYHMSVSSALSKWIIDQLCRKIMIYHNITPASYYTGYDRYRELSCLRGLRETESLSGIWDYALADSEYNKKNLEMMGYDMPIDVLPILISFDEYDAAPSRSLIKKYGNDGYKNIIFTGRIVPNKKQEDVIAAFCEYQKNYEEKSRLFLVGSSVIQKYTDDLKAYIEKLGERDVYITGHVSNEELAAYYQLADLFLCMSEHEGFCVPLLEAMHFEIPIIAYECTAVGETLGDAGIRLKEKDPLLTAGIMDRVISDQNIRSGLLSKQQVRLRTFSKDRVKDMFINYINGFIGTSDK